MGTVTCTHFNCPKPSSQPTKKGSKMVFEKTREEFIVWIRLAMNDRESGAYEELYQFLTSCFVRADTDKDGKVTDAHFDNLIEEAAELPRKYGYAPKTNDMFPNRMARETARAKQFRQMDKEGLGYITLNQWIRFAIDHIAGKIHNIPKDFLSGTGEGMTKQDFIAFVKKAINPRNEEHKELYHFLVRTFQAGDISGYGEVGPTEFDEMIECAANAPRRFGLAPRTEDMFKTKGERFVNRVGLFSKMNTQSTGKISFDEWLAFALEHIGGKVATV